MKQLGIFLSFLFLLPSLTYTRYLSEQRNRAPITEENDPLGKNPFRSSKKSDEELVYPEWSQEACPNGIPLSFAMFIETCKDPSHALSLGADVPKAILIKGLPGTGKTTMVKAAAHYLALPLRHSTGSDFISRFFGEGSETIRTAFDVKKKTIFFIDEVDMIASKRTEEDRQGNRNSLTRLLTSMEGFETNKNIILICTTNFPECLDGAFLRRLDAEVEVSLPNEKGRTKILTSYFKGITLDPKYNPAQLAKEFAKKTAGFSGAYLERIAKKAANHAAYKKQSHITKENLLNALELIKKHKRDNPPKNRNESYTKMSHSRW